MFWFLDSDDLTEVLCDGVGGNPFFGYGTWLKLKKCPILYRKAVSLATIALVTSAVAIGTMDGRSGTYSGDPWTAVKVHCFTVIKTVTGQYAAGNGGF
jgi:hypothetical protein